MTKNEEFERLKKMAEETGFTHAAFLDVSTIQLMPEVRQMCASNSCHMSKAGTALRPVEAWKNVRRKFAGINGEFLFRRWESWRILWMERE